MSYLIAMKTSVLCRECVFSEPLARRRGRAPKSLPQTTIREKLNIRHASERSRVYASKHAKLFLVFPRVQLAHRLCRVASVAQALQVPRVEK